MTQTQAQDRRIKILKNRSILRRDFTAYGGSLYNTRNNRWRARPLVYKKTSMHFVLRSTKACGSQSFLNPKIKTQITKITHHFAKKHKVKIIRWANVGNHLHFHVVLSNRKTYKAFIRALTSSIATATQGNPRWVRQKTAQQLPGRFWDHRPFSRVVRGKRYFQVLNNYIWINKLEGRGYPRALARLITVFRKTKIPELKNPYLRP